MLGEIVRLNGIAAVMLEKLYLNDVLQQLAIVQYPVVKDDKHFVVVSRYQQTPLPSTSDKCQNLRDRGPAAPWYAC